MKIYVDKGGYDVVRVQCGDAKIFLEKEEAIELRDKLNEVLAGVVQIQKMDRENKP